MPVKIERLHRGSRALVWEDISCMRLFAIPEVLDRPGIISADAAYDAREIHRCKRNLGVNATLAGSMAVARAAAAAQGFWLREYSGDPLKSLLPVPMMNILNGDVHANWQEPDFQEYMIAPLRRSERRGSGPVGERDLAMRSKMPSKPVVTRPATKASLPPQSPRTPSHST
jgi:hypothetical protein